MTRSFARLGGLPLIIVGLLGTATPAMARHHYSSDYNQYQNSRYYDGRGYYRESRYERERRYDQGDYRAYRDDRCDKGTGGTIIGAIAGGLLGNEVVGRRGDRTAGVIIGAGVGALAGRAIDRSNARRC